jgi:hypothetical protein
MVVGTGFEDRRQPAAKGDEIQHLRTKVEEQEATIALLDEQLDARAN